MYCKDYATGYIDGTTDEIDDTVTTNIENVRLHYEGSSSYRHVTSSPNRRDDNNIHASGSSSVYTDNEIDFRQQQWPGLEEQPQRNVASANNDYDAEDDGENDDTWSCGPAADTEDDDDDQLRNNLSFRPRWTRPREKTAEISGTAGATASTTASP